MAVFSLEAYNPPHQQRRFEQDEEAELHEGADSLERHKITNRRELNVETTQTPTSLSE